jgi:hypothetical protein
VRRSTFLLVLALLAQGLLAGCGGSATPPRTAPAGAPGPVTAMRALIRAEPALAGTVRMLFEGSGWSVVQSTSATRASAVPFHLVGGRWRADRPGGVTITILGPEPGDRHAPALPQVAMEIRAHSAFVESALWVDGTELEEKGGGSPTNGTIYGAPAHSLRAGMHVAVGYARTATTAAAVAWIFDVS